MTKSLTKQQTRELALGTWVYCTVHGSQGWTKVTAVRPRDGYIKISGFNLWCPPYNFSLTDSRGDEWKYQ